MNKNAMYRFGYGLYVLTVQEKGFDNGCIINTAIQITDAPKRILIAVNRQNRTRDMLMNTGVFTVSMISEEADFELFRHFGFQSGNTTDKFADFDGCKRGENGVYYITRGTNAYVSAKVISTQDIGTHTVFIAEVTDAEVLTELPTASYSYYQEHIKPKPAKVEDTGKTAWVCKICGYVYEGDPLPEDFVCPVCKHGASDFEKINQAAK